jgi:hypothetical protein
MGFWGKSAGFKKVIWAMILQLGVHQFEISLNLMIRGDNNIKFPVLEEKSENIYNTEPYSYIYLSVSEP